MTPATSLYVRLAVSWKRHSNDHRNEKDHRRCEDDRAARRYRQVESHWSPDSNYAARGGEDDAPGDEASNPAIEVSGGSSRYQQQRFDEYRADDLYASDRQDRDEKHEDILQ